jgi:3-methyladenine DNA glycosylase AlkD
VTTEWTAQRFVERLRAIEPRDGSEPGDGTVLGLRMRDVFGLAAEFVEMPPAEIDALLDSDVHEVRVGALSIMDKQARRRRTPPQRREELFALYLRRHDRIDTWDLVDVACQHVVGGYLADRPRDVLYELARSAGPWERRTAIVSTLYFVRNGEVDDTFAIAALLVDDDEHFVRTAVGGLLREAGKKDPARLLAFLDEHAAAMPRIALRFATEKLDPELRARYRGLRA